MPASKDDSLNDVLLELTELRHACRGTAVDDGDEILNRIMELADAVAKLTYAVGARMNDLQGTLDDRTGDLV